MPYGAIFIAALAACILTIAAVNDDEPIEQKPREPGVAQYPNP